MRLLVVSTAKNTDRIVRALQKEHQNALEVVLHIGRSNANFRSSSLSRVNRRTGRDGHLFDDRNRSATGTCLFDSPDYLHDRDLFVEHMMRHHNSYHHRAHPLCDPQDFYDYFHVLCDAIAEEIMTRKVSHCLLFNLPHLGYDTAVYSVAKALNIPIVIVTQSSLFADRYFSVAVPKDFGHFPKSTIQAEPWPIAAREKLDLHYMQGIKQQPEAAGGLSRKALVQLGLFLLYKRRWQTLNPFYWCKLIRDMQRVYGHFPKWRDPFAQFFHTDALAYFDHLAQFEHQTPDLDGDFVYFPLQLQPEMTTATLGGRFRDQAYALECLSAMLPDQVRILVKENPKQGSYMRRPMFFHRLKLLPKVTILPSWVDTYSLITKCRFVATITGTAGYEARCFGKPALVFGYPWYGDFPGVFRYDPDLDYADIIDYAHDHKGLEQAMGNLLQRSHQGSVDRFYERTIKEFDAEQHDQQVASTLVGLLRGEIEMTFPAGKRP